MSELVEVYCHEYSTFTLPNAKANYRDRGVSEHFGQLVYTTNAPEFALTELTVRETFGEASECVIGLPPGHPMYATIQDPVRLNISVWKNKTCIFAGEISSTYLDENLILTVTAYGGLSALSYVSAPGDVDLNATPLSQVCEELFNFYSQFMYITVPEAQVHVRPVGSTSAAEEDDIVMPFAYRNLIFDAGDVTQTLSMTIHAGTHLDALKEIIDAYPRLSYRIEYKEVYEWQDEGGLWHPLYQYVLRFTDAIPEPTMLRSASLAENIKSLNVTRTSSAFANSAFVISRYTDNTGMPHIYTGSHKMASSILAYGEVPVILRNDELASNSACSTYARKYLEEHANAVDTAIAAKIIDRHYLEPNYQEYEVGEYIILRAEPYGFTGEQTAENRVMVYRKITDLLYPQNSEIDLSGIRKSFSKGLKGVIKI